jgi:hypothetical protein
MLLIDPNFGVLHLFLAYWWNRRATCRSAFSEVKCGGVSGRIRSAQSKFF